MIVQCKHVALAMSLAFAWASAGAFAANQGASDDTKPAGRTKSTDKTKAMEKEEMSDGDFAKAAAEGGVAEVKLGQLAEDKGSNKTVRDLGQHMVDDHTKANEDLKSAVNNQKVSISNQMSAKDQATYSKLSGLSGDAFDRAYAHDMVKDHEADVAMFRHEADSGKDASLKSFAAQTLPTLEAHLKEARAALQTVSPKDK